MPRFVLPALLALLCLGAGPLPPSTPVSVITVVNRAPQPIRELFVTPAGLANWGQNRLDGRNGDPTSIPVGASFALRRRADANCIFDIRVVFADGKTEDRRGQNTCAAEAVTIGAAAEAAVDPATGKPGDDPSFKLFNRAAWPIEEFYATPSGLSNWGQNRFADGPLTPDHSRLVALPRDGNCIYDLRVVFAGKRAMEKKHTNLCQVAELPIP